MTLGERIRNIREEKGLSLRKLSEIAGISASLLSQIETNKVDPSLSTLHKIAQGLGIPPLFLFLLDESLSNGAITRKNQRRSLILPETGISYQIIHSDRQKKMGIYLGTFEPAGATAENLIAHPGEECLLVLDGNLTVKLGEAEHRLESGDSIYFDSSIPHRLVNTNGAPCKFYLIVTPPKY